MRDNLPRVISVACLLAAAVYPARSQTEAPAKPRPLFASTPLVDISGKTDFPDAVAPNDDPATQLTGLCSLAEFRAFPAADRHVYSFDPWPGAAEVLGEKSYAFNFKLGLTGATNEKVAFIPTGGGAGSKTSLVRGKGPDGKYLLDGIGNLNWSGIMEHTFRFDKPVLAAGVVLRSDADMELRKFYWAAAVERNGYPVSYTLADGSVINLGAREIRGALLKGKTDVFVGVVDRSGTGIVAFTYAVRGLAGNVSQSIAMPHLAFVTQPRPAVAPLINLRSSCDFYYPDTIAQKPDKAAEGLASLDEFRFIVGNHRYVYHCDTWPRTPSAAGKATDEFSFDLKGKGAVGQKLTVSAKSSGNDAKLIQATLTDSDALPYKALGGLGNIGKGASSEQTFKFTKPVWGFGVTYRSPDAVDLAGSPATAPLSYTLSDGSVIAVGARGATAGTLAAGGKTFVGVIDKTDKGIASVTVRLQGRAAAAQPVYIEDIAFALAGPPPGNWKLTMADEFEGNSLNLKNWTTGYTFPDIINNELQGYVPENVTVANGLCTIKAEKRDVVNTDRTGRKGGAQKFASGAFTSYDKFTQTYGYFEARLKMPRAPGAGIWPAFWVLPDRGREYGEDRGHYINKEFGRGMEIDIFEFMPWWKQLDGTFPIHSGVIWSYGAVTEKDPAPHGYGSYALTNDGWGPAELNFPKLDEEFHTYGLYWSPERLIFYIDSKPVFRVKDAQHMPDVPHYFLFNIAMSGNGWGKSVDRKHPTMEQIVADLPAEMQIDYFRAYSGMLEEPIPPAPTDIPGPVNKYAPRKKSLAPPAPAAAAPAPATPPAPAAAGEVPAAPANAAISTPAMG